MNARSQLAHQLHADLATWLPDEHQGRLKVFAQFLMGLFFCGSVYLYKVAKEIPGPATNPSKTRKIRRLLDNPAIRVRAWYRPLAENILAEIVAQGLPIRLLLDGSKIGFNHQLLMVAVAYRRRAIPIAWTWVQGPRGHSSGRKQIALLAYVHSLMPAGAQVYLAGDGEFGAVAVLKWLDRVGWKYVLRQARDTQVQVQPQGGWQPFATLITRWRQQVWHPQAQLTHKHAYHVNLAAYWQPGEAHPWLLATNFPDLRAALRLYRKRMWIEELFGDLKGHGFDLESTQLRHFLRLSRLTLGVVLVYLWLIAYGSRVIKNSQRYLVDRADRRDLSIFRIGLEMVNRHITNEETFRIYWLPYF